MVNVNTKAESDYYLIEIDGEVDASSSIYLDQGMTNALQSGKKKILVDCKNLEYISSAGLGVFMSHIQELEASDIKLVLYGLNEKVFKVFEILGLHQVLTITDSFENAKVLANEV